MVNLKNKKVLIVGMGASGLAAFDLLKRHKAKVYIFDDIKFPHRGIGADFKNLDFAVVSPGVPKTSLIFKQLIIYNVPIIAEVELANMFASGDKIAITGTNGKTTTVKLLAHIFKGQKRKKEKVFACGNVGLPYSQIASKTNKKSELIIELSSFQLENIKDFKPPIAIILNLAQDHLDRYSTFEEYILAKANIFKNQTAEDVTIFNYLDQESKKLIKLTQGSVYFFSPADESLNGEFRGVFLSDKKIYFKNGGSLEFLIDVSSIKLLGDKNLENILACVLIAKLRGLNMKRVEKSVQSFEPLKNRLEFVKSIKNISFINDSKATNIASAIADINAISGDKILLLGGSNKGEDFNVLAQYLSVNASIKGIVIYGETTNLLASALSKFNLCFCACKNFEDATKTTYKLAKEIVETENLTVMLVPACASFDEFENYIQRANKFKKIVRAFK